MDTNPQKHLEEFIHRELSKLQDRQAPGTLIPRVFAQIRAREQKPWHRRPWTQWPFGIQLASVPLMLASAFGAVYALSFLCSALLASGTLEPVSHAFSSVAVAWEVVSALGNALLVLGRATGPAWLLLAFSIPLAMYLACVGLGTLCYRMAAHQR
jgi:hypothetical protein